MLVPKYKLLAQFDRGQELIYYIYLFIIISLYTSCLATTDSYPKFLTIQNDVLSSLQGKQKMIFSIFCWFI